MTQVYSGIGMPDSGAMCLSPSSEPRPMRVRWDDVSVWSLAPTWHAPQDDGRTWLILWMRGGGRAIWFGVKGESFFADEDTL